VPKRPVAGPFAAPKRFAGVDLIAISPGVPVQEATVQAAMARGVPVVSEIELFAWGVRQLTPRAKMIAITGSNGKTTTTALTGALCSNAAGRRHGGCRQHRPGGADALMSAVEERVRTISGRPSGCSNCPAFQLETTHTLAADAATVLNVSEDHLDRYAGMDEYAAARRASSRARASWSSIATMR
jgi:UDP-N-acetylmuramoylalanine--D-glutamate ligase